jgi:biopolymer transport protein ExbB
MNFTRTLGSIRATWSLLALAALLAPLPSYAWWNQDWSFRKQIAIDTSAQSDIQAAQAGVPVLVRLHEGVFRFEDAAPGGADLRFVAEDDKTPLKYHIEKFDAVFNLAFIWVQLPEIKAGGATTVWMYYGNPKAADGGDMRATYDPDQVLVYHFAERGTPAQDVTGYANHSRTTVAFDDAALIGSGARFSGNNSLLIPESPSLELGSGATLTWQAWIDADKDDGVIYSRRDGAAALLIGLAGGAPYVSVTGADGAARQTPTTQPLGDKGWHHLAIVATAERIALYVDGKAGPELAGPLPAMRGAATVGADPQNPAAAAFNGVLDELQISRSTRDPAWIRLAALNQGPSDPLVQYGADEQLSSWGSGYVGVILSSVTIDGWVIIALLGVMAVVSWIVMFSKSRQVLSAARANRSFLELFRAVASDFSALSHQLAGGNFGSNLDEQRRRLIQQAPLFRMFTTGITELRQRIAGDSAGESGKALYLSAQSIEAIRAELDQSLVQESQALNRSMVLLTIAISGGPFLGLLGTVVGVMITFAAVALAGDVNVNAIAPGIAAALVATVAGLGVAIPALFGYNYLLTRIKDTTVQMQVFVDAFITRMAESYKEPRALRALAAED